MRKRYRSIVMMPDGYAPPQMWYARWCHIGGNYDFIWSEGQSRETLRSAAHRAVKLDLGLSSRDILVSNMAQLNLEFVDQELGETLHEIVAFYIVHLYRAAARETLEQDPDGRWLTGTELLSGSTSDHRPINPRLTALLGQNQLIRM